MEVKEIFELRKQGYIEEAYEAIRPIYAVHKGKYTTLCMFWTANDILKKRLTEQRWEEAVKIFRALLRVAPNIDDNDGRVHAALLYNALRLSEEDKDFRMLDFMEQFGVEKLTEADWKIPPHPSIAKRMLDHAFHEIDREPTVDNALKAMPLLTEVLRRQPTDKQGLKYKEVIQRIIEKAEKEVENPQQETSHIEFGKWGEELAAEYLEQKGYRILERDWHSGHRDIDIIARNTDSIVFVEVKTRKTQKFGEPYEAVNYQKKRNLLAAINHYIRYKRLELRPRFDIISIVAQDSSKPKIEHFEDIRLV